MGWLIYIKLYFSLFYAIINIYLINKTKTAICRYERSIAMLSAVGLFIAGVILFFVSLFLLKGGFFLIGLILSSKIARRILAIVVLVLMIIWIIEVPAMANLVLVLGCIFLLIVVMKIVFR